MQQVKFPKLENSQLNLYHGNVSTVCEKIAAFLKKKLRWSFNLEMQWSGDEELFARKGVIEPMVKDIDGRR